MADKLDSLQRRALYAFREGKSLAVLGGAGCGKSFLIEVILQRARECFGNFPVVTACAPSNQAAERIHGRSIHSTFGAPPYWRWSKDGLWNLVSQKPGKLRALRAMRVLVIDEIFLLTSVVLDSIDYVLRKLAPTETAASVPFGSRQVIFSGDAFQLPEIVQAPKETNQRSMSMFTAADERKENGPVHVSWSWFLTFGGFGSGAVVILDINHRQAGDPRFYNILQRIRVGKTRARDIHEVNSTSIAEPDPPSSHTQLCLRKVEVDDINLKALASIDDDLYSFHAQDHFMSYKNDSLIRRLEQAAPRVVSVKVGCAILLSVSIAGFNSGTHGIVRDIITDPDTARITKIIASCEDKNLTLTPIIFSIRAVDTSVLARREQFPIIAAYAVTVHRCQGMTLSRVAMDFDRVRQWRPFGMVYVALSRCTSLKGLWVRSLSAEHIAVNPDAIKFMEKVELLNRHYPWRVFSSATEVTPLRRISLNNIHTFQAEKRKRIVRDTVTYPVGGDFNSHSCRKRGNSSRDTVTSP